MSTKAAFVIAGMFSEALYPACSALYTLIHRVHCRSEEICQGDGVSHWLLNAVHIVELLYTAVNNDSNETNQCYVKWKQDK